MSNYSAQNSITIKRLRNGDSLFLTFDNNGKSLSQGINETSGAVFPDWEKTPAEQPIITPKVSSSRGQSVSLSLHNWGYNGAPLIFSGITEGGWTMDSTSKFKRQVDTGSLKIVKNLASKVNCASDSLTYECIATVGGIEYTLKKSIDIVIHKMAASSYYGTLLSTLTQLNSDQGQEKATLKTELWLETSSITNYTVNWYKDDTIMAGTAKTMEISRFDVDGTQLFIAEFVVGDVAVYRSAIRIIDVSDDIQLYLTITSSNKEVDTGKPVTVSATVRNVKKETNVVLPATAVWRTDVMEKTTWKVLKTSSSSSIEVTTSETDLNGLQNDVEVTSEVSWTD